MGVNLMPEQLDRVAYDGFLNQDLDGVVVPDVTQLPPVMLQSVIQPVGGELDVYHFSRYRYWCRWWLY